MSSVHITRLRNPILSWRAPPPGLRSVYPVSTATPYVSACARLDVVCQTPDENVAHTALYLHLFVPIRFTRHLSRKYRPLHGPADHLRADTPSQCSAQRAREVCQPPLCRL